MGRVSFPQVRERLGGPPTGLRRLGKSSQMSGSPSRGPRAVFWLSRRAEKDREVLPPGREESIVPTGGSGGVGSPSQRSGRGRESLLEVWEGSKVPSEGLGGVGSPSRRSVRDWEALPEVQEGLSVLPGVL